MAPTSLMRLVPDAPQEPRDILDAARGSLQAPIRSEIFGPQRFAQHGRSLGATHRAARANARAASFFPRIQQNIKTLRVAHHYISMQARVGYDISPAAEWLLDNFHLVETQVSEINKGLPRGYFRTLPILQDEPLAGLPRVYGIAWALVAHTDSAVDEDLYVHFLSAYQETRELTLNELWALPTTLRVVLVENLRRLAERVATNKAAREIANLCCDRIDSYSTEQLDQLLYLMNQRGAGRAFLVQMALRLGEPATPTQTGGTARCAQWLKVALPDLAAAQIQQPLDQAADNLSMSNAVKALRAIGEVEWAQVIGQSSPLMRLLLTQPLFEAEDEATQNRTLHGIGRLAVKCRQREIDVAQTLLKLMGGTVNQDHAGALADHWLSGDGKPQLMASLQRRTRAWSIWPINPKKLALPIYLGTVLAGTLALVAWILLHQNMGEVVAASSLGGSLLVAALMLFPASEAVVAVTNRVISESARPVFLPRLALNGGLAPEHRVMVVIPGLLASTGDAANLIHRLHLHYLANPERHAQFALLTDWTDAASASLPTDPALLGETLRLLGELNDRHSVAQGTDPRFILLHRNRTFSDTEQAWIGWERKRGKLEQLVKALATGDSAAFLDLGLASSISADTRYVLTLDSDTHLPPGRLRELVAVAAHPQNRPRLDATQRRVVSGYGIFQPRVVTPLPAARNITLFHWLFSGQLGIDAYSAAASEIYQDIFGEGTFTGKGLLDVQAMHQVLAGRLPTGQILSHDLLEGALVRCAVVSDITLIEDAPFHPDVAASRMHRWMRGDWQLLPILASPQTFPLRGINRWKMIDNLRRSLVPPVSLALLVTSLAGNALSPWAALLLAMAAFSAGPILGAVAGFAPSRDDLSRIFFYRLAFIDLGRAVSGGLWWLAQLLQQAMLSTDAIFRALYRMAISRRKLLQWMPMAAAEAKTSVELVVLIRRHWTIALAASLIFVALMALATPHPYLAAFLCLCWSASAVWTWRFSAPGQKNEGTALAASDRSYLLGIAKDSWRLFERCVGVADHHLPPDNLQTMPYDMVAHRTSPTNIGLYLMSVACAREFGWITAQEMTDRVENTVETLLKMRRHQGHFLNWYDTQTLEPLAPMYVSTVDSGNLSGQLLAVGQACRRLANSPIGSVDGGLAGRLAGLAKTCEELAWQADFTFLYNAKRRLFHIGFQVAEQKLDTSFYDLLASEAHLTSLLAIAKGDVPVRHWAALGRPFFALGTSAGLRSWSGSMFEYLMPGLLLDAPYGSVLQSACQVALAEQMSFATRQKVPWGISESAYAARDHTLAYQYAPHGVPRLALRRTPADDLVVAPYATALAAQISVHQAIRNFKALEAIGGRGEYGFVDALDFSAGRQTEAVAGTPVATFMAHHQGMTIVALANALLDGVAQRWGMSNPHIEAVSSLLHERVPREISVLPPMSAEVAALNFRSRRPGLLREVLPGAHAVEPTHLLSNGRYSVALRSNGAGWSRWGQAGINRWRDDALRDTSGSFIYLRRPIASSGGHAGTTQPPVHSLTQHPAPDPDASYQSVFHADRVCFLTESADLQSTMTVWVSPEDDIEFRQVELRNTSSQTIELDLISAFDITLANHQADEAHPAFSNLFVGAEWLADVKALLFERKPRLPSERSLHAAHFLVDSQPASGALSIQTDRQRWLGRNHPVSRPAAEMDNAPSPPLTLPATATAPEAVRLATGLDPVCALGVRLQIGPQASAQITFATCASDELGTLHAVVDKYRRPVNVQRASLMSATLTAIRLRALAMGPENFAGIQSLTTALVSSLGQPQFRALRLNGAAETCDKRQLWRFGISGDRPIVLVFATWKQSLGLLRTLIQALRLWSWGGISCDLVILNAEPASYLMTLQREISAMRDAHMAASAAQPGTPCTAIHLLRSSEVSADERGALHRLARLQLNADGRPFLHHIQDWISQHEAAFELRHSVSRSQVGADNVSRSAATPAKGAFSTSSGEYRFAVTAGKRPARPWVNVIANPDFGAQLSEAGGGYTWAVNSRLNQLTTWSNDPVADPPAEWFLLQDLRTRDAWSISPSAWGAEDAVYDVAHGQGYSHIRHRRGDLTVTATWCVDSLTSVKQIRVQVANEGSRTAGLRLVGIAEWTMGADRLARRTVSTEYSEQTRGTQLLTNLLCTQNERSGGFGNGTAFLSLVCAADGEVDWTCDRREFFDARGALVLPDHLGQQDGDGLDPCAALATRVTIAPGAIQELVFHLGYGKSPTDARHLAAATMDMSAAQRLDAARAHWNNLLGATRVTTPDPLFDVMVNRWLIYQTITCRLWAKAGFYQAGGATGFRDQLQDAMATVWAAPALLRQQIVLCASRQFVEGDVQHWWHAPQGAGVRTRFSDDLLWLPHALAHYLRATGDMTVADEMVTFLEGEAIAPGREDAYFVPGVSSERATVYEHCARAIDRSLAVGAHGLPLMGSGDWNDGMNRVGIEGRGESVWLGWFLCDLVRSFALIARGRGDLARAQKWERSALGWTAALMDAGWDGQWFKRAFFDDGQPLGSGSNSEGRIDLIAQAWAVLSGTASAHLQRICLAAIEEKLVDPQAGLVKLIDPPLVHAVPGAGYIQAYPPGVRENGSQYSHAGVWALMAQAKFAVDNPQAGADPDTAYRYFTYLNPAHRTEHPVRGPLYGLEPYVVAGDVYSQPPYAGRGGWSWYTGAAAWMHRAAIESLFGLQQDAQSLRFRPCLPSHWPTAELTLQRPGVSLRFILIRADAAAALAATAQWQARLLPIGQPLDWPNLTASCVFVIPLLTAETRPVTAV